MSQQRIRIWRVFNEPCLWVVGVTAELTQPNRRTMSPVHVTGNINAENYQTARNSLTMKAVSAVNEILALDGVLYAEVRPYDMSIKIAPVFNWHEIKEGVITALQERFFPESKPVIEESSEWYHA